MAMTPEAKRALATTIRSLRTRLLGDLHDATESAYLLSIPADKTRLSEEAREKRARFEAWIAEEERAEGAAKKGKAARSREDFRREAEKEAAYTWLNRLLLLRLLEEPQGSGAAALRALAVVKGGWKSQGYRDFRELGGGLAEGGAGGDATEGYLFLLGLVFEELALELPGLYGDRGLIELVPMPAATLRAVVEALDDPALGSCWSDDMTLGWVYQYWNDPEREALDAKIAEGGKIEPHEIASKTQMFTERYMVDWLLQNTLGPTWLALCARQGWTAEVIASGTLALLKERRADWRARREAGEVALTELMPLHTDEERRWAYYVPPADEGTGATRAAEADDEPLDSIRELRLIDPAMGSGHFLVVAMDLLFALYKEEARHRKEADDARWSDRAIVASILEVNLHGVDLDPRATQIAAAALWLKAQQLAPGVQPARLNLVASNLRLAGLPESDPALEELRVEVERSTGIPGELTDNILHALRGADHLGSLLKVDRAVDDALRDHEQARRTQLRRETARIERSKPNQGDLYEGFAPEQISLFVDSSEGPGSDPTPLTVAEARERVLARIDDFLAAHTHGDDLGLRLRGEQLAAGVRFIRLMREGHYHIVVANPPYQGTSKMADSKYVEQHYPLGKADLYAAFLLRGLELARPGGMSAMLTMRGWMFIKTYAELRKELLGRYDLTALGDFDRGAFEAIPDEVVSVIVSVFRRGEHQGQSIAQCPTPREDTTRDGDRTQRKRAATLCQVGRHDFDPARLKAVPEWPLVYWWDEAMLEAYASAPLIGQVSPASKGICTGDDVRLTMRPWEVAPNDPRWQLTVKGGKGRFWIEAANDIIHWGIGGLVFGLMEESGRGTRFQGRNYYFRRGVAFSMIGANFGARVHRYPSIFGDMGSSVFPADLAGAVCAMNSTRAREILHSINPTIHFQVGDVNRLPLFPIAGADQIFATVEAAFSIHERHREPSVEFQRPGSSPWRHAQEWAQLAVDRPAGAPLPEYRPEQDPEPATDHLSHALGVALGRFKAEVQGAESAIVDPAKDELGQALPEGILFLDGSLADEDRGDGLGHPAAAALWEAWEAHGPALRAQTGTRKSLRAFLREDFFKTVHRGMYENRPIHWPLSSKSRTFVAWVNIHRMGETTLRVLLADQLLPTRGRIAGQLADLREARDGATGKERQALVQRMSRLEAAAEELEAFIGEVEQAAERGPLPTDPKCPPREQDARYAPDLDDGVMVNSAALWRLLEPQWADPKKWWKELATAAGRKDYDWSHLAMRYWPKRVDGKCQQDPSLAVAHGCFWRYHPARAWAWWLRLLDEIGSDFRLEEPPYAPEGLVLGEPQNDWNAYVLRVVDERPDDYIKRALPKEALRRRGRGKKKKNINQLELPFEGLWPDHPDKMYAAECEVEQEQGAPFHIVTPDAEQARTLHEQKHPGLARTRALALEEAQANQTKLQIDEPEDDEPDAYEEAAG